MPSNAAIAMVSAACIALCPGDASAATVTVADGVYAILGSGGEIGIENGGRTANVAFIVGSRGIAVIDTGASFRQGEEIISAISEVSDRPVVAVILTHPGRESIFGAAAFQARGIPVLAHRRTAEMMAARCETCLQTLQSTLGQDFMAGTRVVKPDRLMDGSTMLELIGRPLRVIAPPWSSAPGAIAVFDESTSTLIAGSIVLIHRVPDLRDANSPSWRRALAEIESMRCRHLVPGYGPIGTCADAGAVDRYLSELEDHVTALMAEGVGLADLRKRSDLPAFVQWDQYEALHPQNASRTYLRIEQKALLE
jgi:glyoxylase-like metal-dependent hydrolase (beta-lactamase superfamily II)